MRYGIVEGDEGCIGPSGRPLCLLETPKMHDKIPSTFDCWADPVARLILLPLELHGYVLQGNHFNVIISI